MMVLFVDLEVLSQLRDPLTQKGDLHLGRSSVTCVVLKIVYDLTLSVFRQSHLLSNSSSICEGDNVAENLFEV